MSTNRTNYNVRVSEQIARCFFNLFPWYSLLVDNEPEHPGVTFVWIQ